MVVPGENATPEELAAYRKAIGVPESDDGYTFDPSKLPKEWQVNAEFDSWYKKAAREAGITTKAAQALYYQLNQRVFEEAKKHQASKVESVDLELGEYTIVVEGRQI